MFGPAIAGRLAHFFQEGPSAGERPFPELTQREREVLDLIASGENNQAIDGRSRDNSRFPKPVRKIARFK